MGGNHLNHAFGSSARPAAWSSRNGLLRAIVPAESLPYFGQFATRTAAQYGRAYTT